MDTRFSTRFLVMVQPRQNGMSAIGTKRTFVIAPHMSAFRGKADMPFCAAHVRL